MLCIQVYIKKYTFLRVFTLLSVYMFEKEFMKKIRISIIALCFLVHLHIFLPLQGSLPRSSDIVRKISAKTHQANKENSFARTLVSMNVFYTQNISDNQHNQYFQTSRLMEDASDDTILPYEFTPDDELRYIGTILFDDDFIQDERSCIGTILIDEDSNQDESVVILQQESVDEMIPHQNITKSVLKISKNVRKKQNKKNRLKKVEQDLKEDSESQFLDQVIIQGILEKTDRQFEKNTELAEKFEAIMATILQQTDHDMKVARKNFDQTIQLSSHIERILLDMACYVKNNEKTLFYWENNNFPKVYSFVEKYSNFAYFVTPTLHSIIRRLSCDIVKAKLRHSRKKDSDYYQFICDNEIYIGEIKAMLDDCEIQK